MNEKLNYEDIVKSWVENFYQTMDYSNPYPGDRSGDEPNGVKIIFDGYGYNEETNEDDDESVLIFNVFIHKESTNDSEYPELKEAEFDTYKPDQEVRIIVNYYLDSNSFQVLPFEEGDTELDHEEIYKIIDALWQGNNS